MPRLSKLFDALFKYLVAAMLIVVPLYPKFPFITVPGTYVSIRLEDFLLAVVAAAAAVKVLPQIKATLADPLVRAIGLFLAAGLVSFVSALFITATVTPALGLLHLIRRVEYFVPFLAVLVFGQKLARTNLEFVLKLLIITILLVFVYGVGQRYFNLPVIATQNMETSKGIALRWTPGAHLNSTFAGHYDLATYLVLVLPIVVVGLALLRGKWTKLALGAAWLAGLWLLAASISRISIISYLGGTTLALILARKYKAVPVVLVVSLVFFGMSTDLLLRYTRIFEVTKLQIQRLITTAQAPVWAAEEPFLERVSTPTPTPPKLTVFEDRSTSIRLNVEWPRALRAFTKNPLLGTGLSSITLATDNDYLRLLGEVGVLGLSAFLLILYRLIKALLGALTSFSKLEPMTQIFVAGFAGALPGVLLNAIFIDVFEASKFAIIFWSLAGLVVTSLKYHEAS